jgi:hypothetical protein
MCRAFTNAFYLWFPKTCDIITTTGSEHANSGCPPLLMLHWTATIPVYFS